MEQKTQKPKQTSKIRLSFRASKRINSVNLGTVMDGLD